MPVFSYLAYPVSGSKMQLLNDLAGLDFCEVTPAENEEVLILVPACTLLFLGIWIEKGIGLIVPGLVPSPLGEVVNYAPSWVEVSITLGILALGIFVVSLLLKPALIIEQRCEEGQ